MKLKIKKGDKVLITAGKDRGKIQTVERVLAKDSLVLVTGANLFKRHLKPRGEGKPGGIVDIPRPLTMAKLAVICPKCNQPTRIGYESSQNDQEKKGRICRKCRAMF